MILSPISPQWRVLRHTGLCFRHASHGKLGWANSRCLLINDWLSHIKAVIDTATSLDEVPNLIINAFNDLPDDKLVEIIQMAMMAGTLSGMAEVVAENE